MGDELELYNESLLNETQRQVLQSCGDGEERRKFWAVFRAFQGGHPTQLVGLSELQCVNTAVTTETSLSSLTLDLTSGKTSAKAEFYKKVFRRYKFVTPDMEVYGSVFCNSVFEWKQEVPNAERWVELRKESVACVSESRTQLQNRLKEYFVGK